MMKLQQILSGFIMDTRDQNDPDYRPRRADL